MKLQEKLNELKAKNDSIIPKDKLEVMHRATEELEKSGLKDQPPRVGDKAPDFFIEDAAGGLVSLRSLLKRGPVVLSFFRGQW